ncbi:MAG: hypothetical protein MJ180_01530 [Candidatus Gastranaerophilales bacterium]|nr:hypothetical protein [Candidatus Gastranaerophilales bacterium]
MLKISRTLFDHIKEKDFTKFMFIDPEQVEKMSGNIFIRLINHILPVTKKFLRETFNAKENDKILSQVSLVPDGFSHIRFQISSLKIREGYEFSSKPLIDYVVNNYGGRGVASFLVYIDECYPEIISLFKNECGFRSCSKIEFYTISDLNNITGEFNSDNFKKVENKDITELLEINTMNIFPHFRPSLISRLKTFKKEFIKHTKKNLFKVFRVNGRCEGYFKLYTNDNKNFVADIITSKAYEQCYEEILAYIKNYLSDKKSFESLTVLLKKYRETSIKLEEILTDKNFRITNTTHILVKDYWQRVKEGQSEEKLFVFFNDLNVGCNFSGH